MEWYEIVAWGLLILVMLGALAVVIKAINVFGKIIGRR